MVQPPLQCCRGDGSSGGAGQNELFETVNRRPNPTTTTPSSPSSSSGVTVLLNHDTAAGEPQTPFTLLPPPSFSNVNDTTIESLQQQQTARPVVKVVTTVAAAERVTTTQTTTTERSYEVGHGIPERTEWGPSLSLPDIDDISVNYTFLYMEHYKVDLFWSMLSDSFFILGGLSYIVLTAWDYYIYKNTSGLSTDDSNNGNTATNRWYIAMDLIAPTVYLLNSIIDIHWAEAVRLRLLNKQGMTKIWDDARLQLYGLSFTSSSVTSTYDYSNETDVRFCGGCTWCHRFRKYAAHRRTMMAAIFFGIAATLAVVAAILRNFYRSSVPAEYDIVLEISPWVDSADSILDALSDHVYIISAIFSMTGKRHRQWLASSDPHTSLGNDSERLEDLGDLLFLIGSVSDATLSDLRLKHLVLLPILSSILWMVDGCLYMRSDIVKASKLRDEATTSQSETHPVKYIV